MYMMCAGIAIILLALAAGYIVLLKADKAEAGLKKIGKIIGWVIVVVAALSLLWSVKMSMVCSRKGYCGYGRAGMHKSMHRSWKKGKGKNRMMGKDYPYTKKHKYMDDDDDDDDNNDNDDKK